MATSNRDRIGKMFDLMSPALEAFLERVLRPGLAKDADWAHLVALKDRQDPQGSRKYSRTDPLLQLRLLSENITQVAKTGWHPFDAHLSRGQKSFAVELRDVRNAWAHGQAFSTDDTYRALDTGERLLRAVGAVGAADEVAALRTDLRRVTAERDDRNAAKASTASVEGPGLPAWRDVLQPHEDVATGRFNAAEFAADLYKVSTGAGDVERDYSDPAEFFARTYLTSGLRDLLGRAVRRITGDANASPVINLQTNFGGGKTHSMLALWHLAAGRPLADFPQAVQELLVESGYPPGGARANRVALVRLAPSGSTKPDGTHVRTMWGELAWQLGGREAFEIVADADRDSTTPGPALHRLLESYAPVVILIDEWVAYARQLVDRDGLAAGSFETQFSFAQDLTETVSATPGVLLAISIPASENADGSDESVPVGNDEEVGGTNGREALRRLQNAVRRVADQWRPASAEESYEIVRRRLFVEPDAAALSTIARVAKEFRELYSKHSTDFPREAKEIDYEERIRRSYPIHPELFDRLYEDWSTLDRFQRTRGVLRLMNNVIHDLWITHDRAPLIMPGSVRLAAPRVNSDLTQYLSDSWRAVIDADVDGDTSTPATIDKDKSIFGQRSVTRRLARTVFFGAAPTIGSAHVGLETQRVFLGTAVPGDVPGNFHSALTHLADRATYFYTNGSRYWYDTQANITRRAKDQAERLHQEDVWAEIVKRLDVHRKQRGGFAAISVAPLSSGDVADQDEVRLVLIHPKHGYSRQAGDESAAARFAHEATEKRGTALRTYRNMIVFLAGDSQRLAELETSVRDFLAWQQVAESANELNLTAQQVAQAKERRDRADRTSTDRLLGAYHWVLVPKQDRPDHPFGIAAVKAEGSATSLAERVTRKLAHTGDLQDTHTATLVRMDLNGPLGTRWTSGHVAVGELWDLYATYPYLRRLRDRDMLAAAIRSGSEVLTWHEQGFAVAESYNATTDSYEGLVLPTDRTLPGTVHDQMLVVRPDRALAQRDRERVTKPAEPGSPDGVSEETAPGSEPTDEPPSDVARLPRRFFGSKTLSPDRYAGDFRKVAEEVLQHLAAVPGVRLTVRVDIEADSADGFDQDRVRTVSENSTTLRFDQHAFEED